MNAANVSGPFARMRSMMSVCRGDRGTTGIGRRDEGTRGQQGLGTREGTRGLVPCPLVPLSLVCPRELLLRDRQEQLRAAAVDEQESRLAGLHALKEPDGVGLRRRPPGG